MASTSPEKWKDLSGHHLVSDSNAPRPTFLTDSSTAFWPLAAGMLSLVFMVGAVRINAVFLMVFFTVALGFLLLAGSFWEMGLNDSVLFYRLMKVCLLILLSYLERHLINPHRDAEAVGSSHLYWAGICCSSRSWTPLASNGRSQSAISVDTGRREKQRTIRRCRDWVWTFTLISYINNVSFAVNVMHCA